MTRLYLIAVLIPLALDCALMWVAGGSFRNTLSAEAWVQRESKYWGWCYRFINGIFFWQNNHCRGAWAREAAYNGNRWAWWLATFKGE
jgi:hypothetical protein